MSPSFAFQQDMKRIVSSERVDAIHADQLTMAQFALPYRNDNAKPALIFDAHNAVWTIVERLNATLPFYYRLPLIFEAGRVKAYEARIVKEFDRTLAVAEPDARALRQALREQYNAVTEKEAPIKPFPLPWIPVAPSGSIGRYHRMQMASVVSDGCVSASASHPEQS
jgi:hypothetical protein